MPPTSPPSRGCSTAFTLHETFFLHLLLLLRPSFWAAAEIAPLVGGVDHGSGGGDPAVVRFPCTKTPHQTYSFCNSSLPVHLRAHDIVSRLDLREKFQLLSDAAAPVPRLGIPAYEWWSESLHGLAQNGPGVNFSGGPISAATVFPQVLLQAAAFNRTLWSSVASAIAVEARAMYNVGQAGLTFWAPNVNLFRDPRWGRGQETAGEDPMLASAFAVEYVKSLQGGWSPQRHLGGGHRAGNQAKRSLLGSGDGGEDGDSPLMLSACCKHYAAYDLEAWGNFSRYTFNALVTEQDMGDTYLPPFRSCVREGGASCLMCSYNEVDGVPSCASRELLQLARDEWGLQGYITSDCNAVATIYEYQRYAATPEDAVSDALTAGVDINCGGYYTTYAESAINQGKLREEDVDRALVNLFSVQIRLGLFDGDPAEGPFGELGPRHVCSAEHQGLAMEAARQGIVLLKNKGNFLPLRSGDVASLAVVGPAAKSSNSTIIGGGYTGIPCKRRSLHEGLQAFVREALFASGCPSVPCASDDGFAEAVAIAREADAVVVVAGLDTTQEDEDHDRVSLLLPGKQEDLVNVVAAASKLPIVLVLMGGGPLDVSFAKEDPRIASILWIGYPGEAGGRALAEVIFGEFNPGGRLPMTWYPESFTSVPMDDMHMRPDPSRHYPGRTYRFYTGDVVYGFGHGLSYSGYSHEFLSVPDKIDLSSSPGAEVVRGRDGTADFVYVDKMPESSCAALGFPVVVSVRQLGIPRDGSHAVLLFFSASGGGGGRTPRKQLIGFDRVHSKGPGGATTTARMAVDPCEHLSIVDEAGSRILRLGEHALMLEGGQQRSLSIE
ncbi:unnamed protein product [Spirodela intermedia]|uniref:Fibronectin type III-like domain-containing protein n=1 Tax=Spirodela intermedia TaxID=51605 RepID=A0A7I8K8G5_SPIIN|nr:unnamed protein product [Spirodela intermedia]